MSKSTQFFCRQPKSIDLFQDYQEIATFPKPTQEVRCALYSANGAYFAYTQPTHVTVVSTQDKNGELVAQIDIKETFDLHFSPNGKYLCLWTKPVLLNKESGIWTDNVLVYDVESKEILCKWSNKHQAGWKPQFTVDGKYLAKNVNNKEIHFYELTLALDIKKPTYRYKNENGATFQSFQLSPGLNPALALFFPEKSGKPAQVIIYSIPNFSQPICLKSFFKAEKCSLQWNALGTALLALASTDHDSSNKSYYGETNLYLLGIAGSYERIDLKREGPIHDITWSPSAREFAVSYGYMPSETTFFDARGNLIHSLPTAPRNTILYSPHGRFVLVAGFGNLQGTVDVYDRQNKFLQVCSFEAANTSVCEWSPCGRFILTATTSPRLRVDNGLKVWHASGKLVYYKEYPELLTISWKPQNVDKFPPLRQLEACPEPQASAQAYLAKRASLSGGDVVKKAGAYRPPHARSSGASAASTTLSQRELQSATPAPVSYAPGARRAIPGLTVQPKGNKPETETTAVAPEDKKIRSLLKKLRAIEGLKTKQAGGETLEATQISKINKESEITSELAALGWKSEKD